MSAHRISKWGVWLSGSAIFWKSAIILGLLVVWSGCFLTMNVSAQATKVDWRRVRQIIGKHRSGANLSQSERDLLVQARTLLRSRRQRGQRNNRKQLSENTSLGLKPLDEMTAYDRYKGEEGGLYGDGSNAIPRQHREQAMRAAQNMIPLDRDGNPSPDGKIVLISLGMSNTLQHFETFQKVVGSDPAVAKHIVLVNGAQGGQEAIGWATNRPRNGVGPWDVLDGKLREAGVTRQQVQAAWVLLAVARPADNGGDYPGHTNVFHDACVTIFQEMARRFPNLRMAYQTTRIYAGYASTVLNPEPYCYEYGFAVRRLIQEQIDGNPDLNADPARGPVRSPILLWGPYVWGDGMTPRHDGIVWTPKDMREDGTHPSDSGRMKMSRKLLQYLLNHPTSRDWFGAKSGG